MSKNNNPGCLTLILDLFHVSPTPPHDEIIFLNYSKRDSILTPNEKAFFDTLSELIGDKYTLFSKVRLADIFFINSGEKKSEQPQPDQFQTHRFLAV